MAEPSSVPRPEQSEDGGPARRSALLIGVAAVLAAVAVIVAVVVATGDDDASGSACVADLVGRVDDPDAAILGADLVAARAQGYDDSSVEALLESMTATGVRPDPLSHRVHAQYLELDGDLMPYEPSDVECYVDLTSSFVARGDFDPDRVATAERGDGVRASADGTLVATDPSLLRSPVDRGDEDLLVPALDAVTDGGPSMFYLVPGRVDGEVARSWIGSSLGQDDAGTAIASFVWAYSDEEVAADAEVALRDLLERGTVVTDLVAGNPSDDLERTGRVLILRSELVAVPTAWMAPIQQFDPILQFDPYVDLGG